MHWRLTEKDLEALQTISIYNGDTMPTRSLLSLHLNVSPDQANKYLSKFKRFGLVTLDHTKSNTSTHGKFKLCYILTPLAVILIDALTQMNTHILTEVV